MMIKICVLDPHEISRNGISLLLDQQPNFLVTAKHSRPSSLLEQLPDMNCDILIITTLFDDVNNKPLLHRLLHIKPLQKIIFIAIKGNRQYAQQLAALGQPVYSIDEPIENLIMLINHVHGNAKIRTTTANLTQTKNTFPLMIAESDPRRILTKREMEILHLIYLQYSNIDIAQQLYLSISTVETHRKNIIRKLGANNTVGIIKYVVNNNLFPEITNMNKYVSEAGVR